jgi:L-alanine-DL-glutamate epimerase-like enolase superfamily enzyme
MIVRRFRTHHVSVPLGRRLINGSFEFERIEHVLLELDVGDATGIGHAFAFERRQAESIRVMVLDLAETLVGSSVEAVRAVWGELWQRLSYIGHSGPPVMALSVVDTAIWDLLAQRAGLPLFRLLGAARSSIPVYATGGWLTYSKEELVEEALGLRERGFVHYKMKVGNQDWRIDVDRVAHLAEAVAGEMAVMVDANQAWTVPQAIAAGRALRELGVAWLEEPVAVEDVAGSARVAAAVDIPLAGGESLFTRHDFLRLIESRAADVAMPDLMRSGGPAEFLQIATLADAYDMPVSSHAFTEVSAHLMAACPNASFVESIPGWTDDLFDTPPRIADGQIHLPERPGLGFKFAERTLHDRAVDAAPWR